MPWNEDGPGRRPGSPPEQAPQVDGHGGGGHSGGGHGGDGRGGDGQGAEPQANPWARPRPRLVRGQGQEAGGPDGRPADGGRRGPSGGLPPRGNNPWGPGSGGNGGGPVRPPDLNRLKEQMRDFLANLIPGLGGGSGNGGSGNGGSGNGAGGGVGRGGLPGHWSNRRLGLIGVGVVVLIWLASGFYRVQPDQQGVVLRFGAYAGTTYPGLNYHLPWPIERVELPVVTRVNRTEIGYRSSQSSLSLGGASGPRDVAAESLMLTGDENIIDVHVALFWRIADARKFLFDTRDPVRLVKAVAESSMREVIGRTPIQPALTTLRPKIEADVLAQTQQILNRYGAGIDVIQVQLQKVDPPAAVIESFLDVQRANTDAERMRNEAESYRNSIVPVARGDAAQIIAEADANRQAAIAQAKGETRRFLSVLAAYRAAKDITLKRLYLQTMEDVLAHNPATIIDPKLQSVLPLLPLNAAGSAAAPLSPNLPAPTSATSNAATSNAGTSNATTSNVGTPPSATPAPQTGGNP